MRSATHTIFIVRKGTNKPLAFFLFIVQSAGVLRWCANPGMENFIEMRLFD